MVNDTTTLNGALSELGETMADNLFSMGVIDADASDGLTTLANKILNIEPSISGLDLDTSLILHSSDDECLVGQSIMFWAELKADYDDETATDVDLSGVLTGATVTFKYGNTVLGTGVTDGDGIAYYTHTFATVGVYDISASFAGTENFDDCVSSSITVSVTYEMTITADKPILSFADSDVATITATLSDGVAGVGGEILSYEVLDKDDNVLDSGSDVTDASGEISFSYQSLGIGDVQVVVYYGIFLQETYELEDYFYWNDNEIEITGTNKHTLYDPDLSVALPTNAEISFDVNTVTTSATKDYRWWFMSKSLFSGMTYPSNSLYFDKKPSYILYNQRANGSDKYSAKQFTASAYATIKYVKNGTTVKVYVDGTLMFEDTVSWIENYSDYTISAMKWSGSETMKMKNVKVKAL